MLTPCLSCGELCEGSRCPECSSAVARLADRSRRLPKRRGRGYDSQWQRLSARARELQPFCLDCGATHDLTADHLPSAWYRKYRGLSVRLEDVEVVCRECNRRRGEARPGSVRYRRWLRESGLKD